MIRILPFFSLIELALLVYCVIDCVQTDSVVIRNLPKITWVLLILIFPLVGGIAWLVAGRPERGASPGSGRRVSWPSTPTSGFPEHDRPPRGPDDDPQYQARMRELEAEERRDLARWQEQLRQREEQLRAREGEPGTAAPPTEPPIS